MSEDKNSGDGINRRDLMKKTGTLTGTGLGVAAVPGNVLAWEDGDANDRERLAESPRVQAVLQEIGEDELPDKSRIERMEIDLEELNVFKVSFPYGDLIVGQYKERQDVHFQFNERTHSGRRRTKTQRPEKFRTVPAGTEPELYVIGDENSVRFHRLATQQEREAVLSMVPREGNSQHVYTTSDISGFYADVTFVDPEDEENKLEKYKITVPKDIDTTRREVTELTELGPEQYEVETQSAAKIAAKVGKDRLVGFVQTELAEELGPCGPPCVTCLDFLIDYVSDCSTCTAICSTSASGVTAVVCIACIYQFCNNIEAGYDCAKCMACATEGPETIEGTPDTGLINKFIEI